MKKILAILTLLAVTSVSASAFAACGSNTGRNSHTTPTGTAGPGTAGPAAGAGYARTGTPR